MSSAKQVLEPAFQGAGQKPYPYLHFLWDVLLVCYTLCNTSAVFLCCVSLNDSTVGLKYGGLRILTRFLYQNRIMVNSTVEIHI
jgi:hypothetical protein